ncbi:chemosensory receptor b [Plakobranchus ocellatus]|uniref:Chemosensory receptor b n=1 Tax=Plakobranchus ocellatus TaxID=259542 RepID=A0AAV3XU56_9GAST|nr:chemosensory receptor b [Plakobranchus ocellatus]
MAANALDLTTVVPPGSADPVSDHMRDIFMYINFVTLGTLIGIFGIVTNIFNIIVYKRLGFKVSTHVTLFAMSISDLASLITLIWTCMCLNPALTSASLDFSPTELQYLVGGIQHVRFVRITCWLTVWVTIERCMCLVIPVKVKSIFTPKSSTIAATVIFAFFLLSQIPNALSLKLGWKFYKAENRSRIGVLPTQYSGLLRNTNAVLNLLLQFLSLIAILTSNCLLVLFFKKKVIRRGINSVNRTTSTKQTIRKGHNLRASAVPNGRLPAFSSSSQNGSPSTCNRREGNETLNANLEVSPSGSLTSTTANIPSLSDQTDRPIDRAQPDTSRAGSNLSVPAECEANTLSPARQTVTIDASVQALVNRDKRMSRLILLLSAIFIITYLPSTICLALVTSMSGFRTGGRYYNSFMVAYSFSFVFEAIGASVNIFPYYFLSTNFRQALDRILHRRSRRVMNVAKINVGLGDNGRSEV